MRFPTKLLQLLMIGAVFLLPAALMMAQDVPLDAVDDVVYTNVNTLISFDVLANDTGNLDPASAAAISFPAGGVLISLGNGQFEYTPMTDFTGMVTFSYQVCDTNTPATCDTALVTIHIAATFAPDAVDDSAATAEDTPVTISVLANDFDPDANLDPSSVTVIGGPTNGSAVTNADGTVTYTPALNYFGSDNFTYSVCDLDALCDTATVSVDVTPVNDPPDCSAAYPSISVLWPPNHQMVSVQILGVTDVENDPFTLTISGISVNEPDNGTGDGDTSGDVGGIGTDTAQVRAERAGGGDGRVYEITFVADDGLENGASTCRVIVTVPHDQGDDLMPLPEATEEVVQPGDFGCDHPGNYCNAPGQNKETVEEETQSQDQTRNNSRNSSSQNANNGKKDDPSNKDKDKDKGNGNGKGNGKNK
ncbi:MAG: tandem-95 repeat protein [Anaerolineae bacterium]|nr:tandem-95 repeat protein [Anaerolineae bacterium]